MPAIHVEFTEYYFPDGKDYPSKIVVLVHTLCTCVKSFVWPETKTPWRQQVTGTKCNQWPMYLL